MPTKLLAISGSVRKNSTNTALLRRVSTLAPPEFDITVCDHVGQIPIFSPDLEGALTPDAVETFAAKIGHADGLLFACPEYAHGIPGGLKNALDWLVSRFEVPDKPVMILHASERGAHAKAALAEVLRTMSMNIVEEASLTLHLIGKTPDEIDAIIALPQNSADIVARLHMFAAAIAGFQRQQAFA